MSSPTTIATTKPYDIIIIGASGFTGRYITREALKFLNAPNSPLKTLALAGRSPARLFETLAWASGDASKLPPNVYTLTIDIRDSISLSILASQGRIIINCVGPYQLLGEPVVGACVDHGCDYLDICGEPEFMERIELLYHEKAVKSGSLIVSSCGFDSVPAEIGLLFHLRQWISPAAPNRVVTYLQSDQKVAGNYGTYASAVYGYARAEKLVQVRRSKPKRSRPSIPGPPPSTDTESIVQRQKHLGLWSVNLPAADASVVRRTLTTLAENPDGLDGANESPQHIVNRRSFWSSIKPAYFSTKFASKSIFGLLPFLTLGFFFEKLCKSSLGQHILLRYPGLFSLGLFSKRMPTEAEVNEGMFRMWFVGEGYSDAALASTGEGKRDMTVVTRVTGPDMGYLTSSMVLIQCALVMLGDRENLPVGGVYTPGIVFGPSGLQERLQEEGLTFDYMSTTIV